MDDFRRQGAELGRGGQGAMAQIDVERAADYALPSTSGRHQGIRVIVTDEAKLRGLPASRWPQRGRAPE